MRTNFVRFFKIIRKNNQINQFEITDKHEINNDDTMMIFGRFS